MTMVSLSPFGKLMVSLSNHLRQAQDGCLKPCVESQRIIRKADAMMRAGLSLHQVQNCSP
jgi:hypothetical protein